MKKNLKKIIDFIFKLFNLKIIRANKNISLVNRDDLLIFDQNNPDYELYFEGLKKSDNEESDNFFKQSRYLDLINLVKFVLKKNETSDFVELGCWHGHSSYIISSLIKKFEKKNVQLHIFDSFEGLSDPTNFDENLKKIDSNRISKIKSQFKSNEEFVKDNVLADFDFVKTYKGWIPEKFHILENKKFSFVHIDVDLYSPTLESLKFFYPKLEDGGVLICDDYNSKIFNGAKKACDEYFFDKKYKFSFNAAFGSFFVIK